MIIRLLAIGEYMSIEISSEEYERFLNYDDGLLYCSMVVIEGIDNWRMPTEDEMVVLGLDITLYWGIDTDVRFLGVMCLRVRPVRDC